MELQLKHIAPYLPYDLKCEYKGLLSGSTKIGVLKEVSYNRASFENKMYWSFSSFKPILHPISDLKSSYFSDLFDDDIDVRTFLNDEFLESRGIETYDQITEYKIEWLPFGVINLLIKHHFDVFDLISQGLAVDVNSLSLVS